MNYYSKLLRGRFKEPLFLPNKGDFISKYNYGNDVVDLGEYVLKILSGCQCRCRYCFVPDSERVVIYNNFEKLGDELVKLRNRVKERIYINAGENADSLLYEDISNSIKEMNSIVKDIKGIKVELRTKTTNVESIIRTGVERDKFIFCFSLMPQNMKDEYEPFTARIDERIKAMQRLAMAGYIVGLRFEPIINTKNLKSDYGSLFKQIHNAVGKKSVHSISFGVIRFTQELIKRALKDRILYRILLDEFVRCPDNKFRYFRKIRVGIYKTLIDLAHKYFSGVPLFLSMESPYIWDDCGLRIFKLNEI